MPKLTIAGKTATVERLVYHPNRVTAADIEPDSEWSDTLHKFINHPVKRDTSGFNNAQKAAYSILNGLKAYPNEQCYIIAIKVIGDDFKNK